MFFFKTVLGTKLNSDGGSGILVLALMLAERFQNIIMAPDIGTKRNGGEFGKLCYDAIVREK